MDYLVKIRSVQTPLNGQFSIGANSREQRLSEKRLLFTLKHHNPLKALQK